MFNKPDPARQTPQWNDTYIGIFGIYYGSPICLLKNIPVCVLHRRRNEPLTFQYNTDLALQFPPLFSRVTTITGPGPDTASYIVVKDFAGLVRMRDGILARCGSVPLLNPGVGTPLILSCVVCALVLKDTPEISTISVVNYVTRKLAFQPRSKPTHTYCIVLHYFSTWNSEWRARFCHLIRSKCKFGWKENCVRYSSVITATF